MPVMGIRGLQAQQLAATGLPYVVSCAANSNNVGLY